jgi:hypothetical protein
VLCFSGFLSKKKKKISRRRKCTSKSDDGRRGASKSDDDGDGVVAKHKNINRKENVGGVSKEEEKETFHQLFVCTSAVCVCVCVCVGG